ncbi:thiamine-phosphate kinase [Caulobacter mirabilis]|uniref:Thiamine-monophosphate kinase n=1 Tax=Caulobacter mirabilis TaxID=69666 RepID=A0A2D2AXP0_9CAUL|nr:thiamine-phosphate kinase [Caulobacter mirabilis]ATQ42778.1 thiamine-phosphate kinase [Caulobacter mirabilis]
MTPGGEFDWIERLLRPLTRGAPEALDLLDDAAVLPSRPGFDLAVTKDAMVAGVHFLPDDPPDLVARKLLRVNLSDLAAKGAEPYGAFLAIAWPAGTDWAFKEIFVRGLAQDGEAYRLPLLGGDTVSTPGPLTLSATLLGWVPAGEAVLRRGAQPGDVLAVSGPIGDGWLGLDDAKRGLEGRLADLYRLPEPRLDLLSSIRKAAAAADISDGLLADAGHIAKASGCAVRIELDRTPLSSEAAAWLAAQPDRTQALLQLATGGDDYQVAAAFRGAVPEGFTAIGAFEAGRGVHVVAGGAAVAVDRLGWSHA